MRSRISVSMAALLIIGCLVLLSANLSFAGMVDLPKTGQTTCYDSNGDVIPCEGTGQDGDIQAGIEWPTPRFTDNGNGTMTDSLTGLMWLKDVNCANSIGYDPDSKGAGYLTWQQAIDFVAAINAGVHDISKCGSYTANYTDWRLPNVNEIENLNSYETYGLRWLTEEGFLNMPPYDDWWTSTSLVDNWSVSPSNYAYTSNAYASYKFNYGWAIPVRGQGNGSAGIWKTGQIKSYALRDDGDLQMGIAWPQPRFINNGDGTITDSLTGLMWLKDANCPNSIGYDPAGEGDGTVTWQQALDFVLGINTHIHDISKCGSYSANYMDWRLPNVREIRSMMDYSEYNPSLPSTHPFINVQTRQYESKHYWTSTTYSLMPKIALQEDLWYAWVNAFEKSSLHFVWPARAGPSGPFDYSIIASAGTGGTISPSGTVTVTSGGSQTFTITANSGYQISDVKVDDVSQGAISTYTFSNVTQDHTISATFGGPDEIDVPDIKTGVLGGLVPPLVGDYYTFTLPYQTDVTISLFSTDFDTLLTLYNGKTGKEIQKDYNGHLDWGNNETDDLGTNSEISRELDAGIYTIEVMNTSGFGIGDYTLVIRDIGNAAIETFCNKLGQNYPAVFPGPNHSLYIPNDWVAEPKLVGDDCVGRCSVGCPDGAVHPCGLYRYTRDCFNHDVCGGEYGSRTDERCNRIFVSTLDDCASADECVGPYHVDPYLATCGGKTPCFSTIQDAIDAAFSETTIKILQGSYDEALSLSASINLILEGGWDATYTSQSSNTTFIKAPKATQGSLTLRMVTIKP